MAFQTCEFKSDTKKVLDLVIHSLYSDKDIFLRELISNASDALDKLRFALLTDSGKDAVEKPQIRIFRRPKENVLVISDTGLGMNREELMEQLGSIASSGSRKFVEMMRQNKTSEGTPEENSRIIGRFGVGFYSVFMVAKSVEVRTRKYGEKQGFLWRSEGSGTFSVEDIQKDSVGTEISLFLMEENKEFVEEWKIRDIVQKYSNYIRFPIVMNVVKKESGKIVGSSQSTSSPKEIEVEREEVLNQVKALWEEKPSKVKDEEYLDFYRNLTGSENRYLRKIHYSSEVPVCFSTVLFLPESGGISPLNVEQNDRENGILLYSERVFILKGSRKLLPSYLRFVVGVVDSPDLDLNVSREMLQQSKTLGLICKSLVGKVLSALKDLKRLDFLEYVKFYDMFGNTLKEGLHWDYERRDEIMDLLLFRSSRCQGSDRVTLEEYVRRAPEGQNEIYFAVAESEDKILGLSHLELFQEENREVLYFLNPLDELLFQTAVLNYKGKPFRSILKGDFDFGKKKKDDFGDFSTLIDLIRTTLESQGVISARVTSRLTSSPCCLVFQDMGLSPQVEKFMMRGGQQFDVKSKRIFEFNPEHPVIFKLIAMLKNDQVGEAKKTILLLHDQALLAESRWPKDLGEFNKRIWSLISS